MKVLLIEDEKKVSSLVRKGLQAQGSVVDVSRFMLRSATERMPWTALRARGRGAATAPLSPWYATATSQGTAKEGVSQG